MRINCQVLINVQKKIFLIVNYLIKPIPILIDLISNKPMTSSNLTILDVILKERKISFATLVISILMGLSFLQC